MNKVLSRIYGHGRGWVFTPKDFLDLGTRFSVDHILSRLWFAGKIRRLARGFYDYPKKHPKLGVLSPDPYIVAKAIVRNKNAKLQISGDYCANILGLSEQVPAKIVFLTDGPSKKIKIGNFTMQFKHVRPSSLIGAGSMSGMIIQAIKYLGENNISFDIIQKIKNKISEKNKIELNAHKMYVPDWVRIVIDQIIDK